MLVIGALLDFGDATVRYCVFISIGNLIDDART